MRLTGTGIVVLAAALALSGGAAHAELPYARHLEEVRSLASKAKENLTVMLSLDILKIISGCERESVENSENDMYRLKGESVMVTDEKIRSVIIDYARKTYFTTEIFKNKVRYLLGDELTGEF
jgi:hypothetical protein